MPDFQILFVDAPGHISTGEAVDHGYSIAAILTQPRSGGTVRLADAKPGTAPLLDPNYYGDDHDLTTMVTALRAAREIGQASALGSWRAKEAAPGPDAGDDAGLRAYVTETLGTINHPVGTCPIGTGDHGVVDLDLRVRVRGITGLRVADASVMPSIVAGYPNAAVYAIAERAAELIGS